MQPYSDPLITPHSFFLAQRARVLSAARNGHRFTSLAQWPRWLEQSYAL